MFRTILLTALISLSPIRSGTANDSAATDAMTIELRALATDFAKIIKKKGGGAVAIGEFSPSSDLKGSVGPRLQLTLAQELRALDIPISSEDFRFEIKGDYQPLVDQETQLLGIKVIGRLIDRDTGEPLVEKPTGRFVFGEETVPEVIGLAISGGPTQDPIELSDRFKEARRSPQVSVQGTQIQGNTGVYAMEILVKRGGTYKAEKVQLDPAGRPITPLHTDDLYGVRLINRSPNEAAVSLSIDGVNCFAFSEKTSRYWIVGPGKSIDVLGWHLSNSKTAEFKVVADFPQTAAAKLNLKPSATIGLITATFSACWKDDVSRPADEQRLASRGTGFGSEIEFKTEQVQRIIGHVRDTLPVRYER